MRSKSNTLFSRRTKDRYCRELSCKRGAGIEPVRALPETLKNSSRVRLATLGIDPLIEFPAP